MANKINLRRNRILSVIKQKELQDHDKLNILRKPIRMHIGQGETSFQKTYKPRFLEHCSEDYGITFFRIIPLLEHVCETVTKLKPSYQPVSNQLNQC